MNEKQRKILEEKFNIFEETYADGKYLELEAWTNGGVDMIIEVDILNNDIISELEDYLDNFDIDEEIDIYRQDKRYREAFRITESVKDFEEWVKFIEKTIKELKER